MTYAYYVLFAIGAILFIYFEIRDYRRKNQYKDHLAQHISRILEERGAKDWRPKKRG